MKAESWKVIRDKDYEFVGLIEMLGETKLMFRNVKFPDECVLVGKAKYVLVKSNKVKFLDVTDSHLSGAGARHGAD